MMIKNPVSNPEFIKLFKERIKDSLLKELEEFYEDDRLKYEGPLKQRIKELENEDNIIIYFSELNKVIEEAQECITEHFNYLLIPQFIKLNKELGNYENLDTFIVSTINYYNRPEDPNYRIPKIYYNLIVEELNK